MNRILRTIVASEYAAILAAIIIPLTYTVLWLSSNTQLPVNDAANYMYTAVTMSQHFTDHSIWHGLKHFFSVRGWRPIFFPNIALPFMLIFHDNLFATYWAVAMLCVASTATYLYLFFRIELDRVSALIATWLVGLLPFVQSQIIMFYAESALFPCMIGTLYHLIKSDYLRNRPHTIGFVILYSLALMIRPVEAISHMIFVMPIFLFIGWKKNIFTSKQLSSLVTVAVFSIFVFSLAASKKYLSFKVLPLMDDGGPLDVRMASIMINLLKMSAIAFFICLVVFIGIKLRDYLTIKSPANLNQPLILPAFSAISIVTLLWFVPFAFETYEWIYRTSLGDVAQNTGSLTGAHFSWNVLLLYLREEGLLVISSIFILAVLTALLMPKYKIKKLIISSSFTYLILLSPFQLWESFYTVQIVTRKLSITFPALIMAALLIILMPGKWLSLRKVLVTILVFVQLFLLILLMHSGSYQQRRSWIENTIGYFIAEPSTITPNPHDVVREFLDSNTLKYHFKSVALVLNPGTPDARHFLEAEPIDPFMFGTALAAMRKEYYTNYAYFSTYSEQNIQQLKKKFDAILLSDQIENMQISKKSATFYKNTFNSESNPSLKTFYELAYYYSSNSLDKIGLKVISCINLRTQQRGDYKACLIIPS